MYEYNHRHDAMTPQIKYFMPFAVRFWKLPKAHDGRDQKKTRFSANTKFYNFSN